MHASNPVHWLPWGPQALEQARRENKPIFVTVGFFACFWCHEMDRTVFAKPGVAALLNRDFVNVVIDREQRPDLDQTFVLAREILDHGSSGWPNNLVLTPQGLPFAAFGVLPAQTTPQQAGFTEVMQRIHTAWQREPQVVQGQADKVLGAMRQVQQASTEPGAIAPQRWRSEALAAARKSFDPLDGGFDPGAERFPHAPLLAFLQGSGSTQAEDMVATTLRAMAEGGIMDQLGGGFHRYAIDPQWSVPHFEKMLSDNAQLLALYAQAATRKPAAQPTQGTQENAGQPQVFLPPAGSGLGIARPWGRSQESAGPAERRLKPGIHDPLFAQVAERTAAFMLARLRLPDGVFASSLSSETGGVEGAPYGWSAEQIQAVLGAADAARFLQLYALVPLPPEPGSDRQSALAVLRINPAAAQGLDDAQLAARIAALAPLRQRLLAAAMQRLQPARDDKAILASNGLAIAALAQAGAALQRPDWVQAATAAAQTLWRQAWKPQTRTLAHEVVNGRAGGPGLLADDALFGQGLLALYRASGNAMWLQRAELLGAAMQRQFSLPDGGLRSTLDANLPVAPPALGDSHEPSAQSAAIAFWLQLAQASSKPAYAQQARRALASFAGFVQRAPVGFGSLLAALDASASHGQAAAIVEASRPPTAATPVPTAGLDTALQDSARVVQASARLLPATANTSRQIQVTLQVAPGYHVNANPASKSYLIPTELLLHGQPAAGVRYPTGRLLRLQSGLQLAVLEGRLQLALPLAAAPPAQVQVRVQACDDKACLPPSLLTLAVTP